jgi:hypothetical protein
LYSTSLTGWNGARSSYAHWWRITGAWGGTAGTMANMPDFAIPLCEL